MLIRHQTVSEIETLKINLVKGNDQSQCGSFSKPKLFEEHNFMKCFFCSLKAQVWKLVSFCQENETMMSRNSHMTLKTTFANTALVFYELFNPYFYLQETVRISSLFFPVKMNIYWYNPIFLNLLLKHQSISNEILNNCLSRHEL